MGLNNLEDVIKLIEEGTNLIVANKPEIIYLEAIVDHLQDEKDIGKIIKASSKMLRVLDSLIPDLSSQTTKLCISTPEASVKAFKDIANVLELISDKRNFNVPSNSKQILTFASKVMVQTADFLESLNESLERFENLCKTDDKDYSLVFSSIVDIMESFAELFEDKSSNILEQTTFIKKIVGAFDNLEDLDTSIECSIGGSYNGLALVLDDLSEIIENVGIEKLSNELGIDIDLNQII